jgi:DNA-binding HxlR family transcriptional regulator
MEYQKQCKAGLIKTEAIQDTQIQLKNIIATLQNVSIINPFATLIHLPDEVAYPRKSLLLLLNFIEVITYFFQYQREQKADKNTGEVFVLTHPNDIELAFKFLRNNLFRRADELSTSARGFYNWLVTFLTEAKTQQFTALDLRKAKPIHPRTLNRYLQELTLFSYIQIAGGNKHRGGFIYKLTTLGNQTDTQSKIDTSIQTTIKNVWNEYNKQNKKADKTESSKTVSQTEVSNTKILSE